MERGEYAPEDIVLTSFTRSAAAVLKGRIEVPRDNVATLHSLARRIVGPDIPIAEVGTLAKEWNESGVPPGWRIGSDIGLVDDDGLAPMAEATSMLSEWSLARSKMLPSGHPTWDRLKGFGAAWDDFKRNTDSIDFTDMIELAFWDAGPLPGNKPVLMVDEAQDLVPLQWQLVRHWATYDTLKDFIVLGDPAQAVYSFAGARPEEMLSEMPEERVRRLGQSHRMPRAIHEFAERYLSNHSGVMMQGREYLPKDEDGSVRRLPATFRVPDLVVTEAERAAAEGRSTLILATCSYMLEPTINLLRQRGLPFSNPYRRSNGRWNPLGARRQGSSRTVDRLAAFSEQRDPHLWLPMLRAEVYMTRGAKKHLEEDPLTWREWMKPEERDAAEAGDVDWLLGHAMKDVAKPLEYASKIIKRHGAQAVEGEPLIMIGTGHSVKGGEADNVILFPDLSQAGGREVMGGPAGRDASIRLGYVMATRAKQDLVICSPGGRDALQL